MVTLTREPFAPGAEILDENTLQQTDLVEVINGGPRIALAPVSLLGGGSAVGPWILANRTVTTDGEAVVDPADVVLFVNKASITTFNLPSPVTSTRSGRILVFKDYAGNAGTFNITLDAGAGKTINGLQTLVMNGNYGTTILIGMSATKWGTLI